jgi:exodeoxyribonuclease-5
VLTWSAVSGAKLVSMMLGADQILVGLNATRRKINAEVRRQLGRGGPLPEVGDKLVCLRNNPDEGLLNGQIWTVARARARAFLELELVGEEGERARCLVHRGPFEGKEAPLDPSSRRRANEFDFGYALTVHRAQGSSWDRVVLCDEWRGTDRAKWLYTAITRAAESITILEA